MFVLGGEAGIGIANAQVRFLMRRVPFERCYPQALAGWRDPPGGAMRRRTFIAVLSAAAAWPVTARAQQVARMRRLGVLVYSTPQEDPQARTLQQGLRDLGYIDGQNISIE